MQDAIESDNSQEDSCSEEENNVDADGRPLCKFAKRDCVFDERDELYTQKKVARVWCVVDKHWSEDDNTWMLTLQRKKGKVPVGTYYTPRDPPERWIVAQDDVARIL